MAHSDVSESHRSQVEGGSEIMQLDPTSWSGADRENSFQVLWEDGDRVLCRGWRQGANGDRNAVLTLLPVAEHPTRASLERLAHAYALRDELDGAWAVRPLALVREHGRTMLVLEDPGGEPLARQIGAPMQVETFLRLGLGISAALGKLHRSGLVHKRPEARQDPDRLPGRTSTAHWVRPPRVCRANVRRPTRPRLLPARLPIWRQSRPGE